LIIILAQMINNHLSSTIVIGGALDLMLI